MCDRVSDGCRSLACCCWIGDRDLCWVVHCIYRQSHALNFDRKATQETSVLEKWPSEALRLYEY